MIAPATIIPTLINSLDSLGNALVIQKIHLQVYDIKGRLSKET